MKTGDRRSLFNVSSVYYSAQVNFKVILRQIQRGFARLMGVSHQSGQDIDHGIDHAAVPGVLDLLDILSWSLMVSMMARLRNNSLSTMGINLLCMFRRIW